MLSNFFSSAAAENAQQEPGVEVITFEVEGDNPFKSTAEIAEVNSALFPRVFEENFTKDEGSQQAAKATGDDGELSVSAAREALSKKLFAFNRFEREQDLPSLLGDFRHRLDVLKSRLSQAKSNAAVSATPRVMHDLRTTQETMDILLGSEEGRSEDVTLLSRGNQVQFESPNCKTIIEILPTEQIGLQVEMVLDRHESELTSIEQTVGANRRLHPYQFELDGFDIKRALAHLTTSLEPYLAGKKECEKMCSDIKERYHKFSTNLEKNQSRNEEVTMTLTKYKQISEAHILTQSCLQYETLVDKCLHLYRGLEKTSLNTKVIRPDLEGIDSQNQHIMKENYEVLAKLDKLSSKMKQDFAAINESLTAVEQKVISLIKK